MIYKLKMNSPFNKSRILALFFVCGFAASSIGCGSANELNTTVISAINDSKTESTEKVDGGIVGSVDRNRLSDWLAVKTVGFRNEKIIAFDYINSSTGFVVSSTSLYRTIDGGRKWRRTPINLPMKGKIIELRFTTVLDGSCIVLRITDETHGIGDLAVFRTTDGGISWKPSFFQDQSIIYDSAFEPGKGWISGARKNGSEAYQLEPFVGLFQIDTEKWNVIKLPEEHIIKEGFVERFSFERVVPDSEGCAFFLDKSGTVYRLCSHDTTWQQVTDLGSLPDDYGPRQLGLLGGNLIWGLMSTGGMNGSASVLTLASLKPARIILNTTLVDYFMTDSFVKSENSIFLVGWPGNPIGDKPKGGIILHSSDHGRTWKTIYEGGDEITRAQFISDDVLTIWVLSKNGQLTRLSPAS